MSPGAGYGETLSCELPLRHNVPLLLTVIPAFEGMTVRKG